jgi:hypothetical protein
MQEKCSMRILVVRQVLRALLLLMPLVAVAQGESNILQSDWMKLVKGYRDPASGVEMRDVVYEKSSDTRTLTLAIPKSALNSPDDIEEVIVVGRRPAKPESMDISYEWLDDDDPDNYGLVIRLGKDSNWPIRLYLDSRPGYQP